MEKVNKMGLTPQEQGVMDGLMIGYKRFLELEREHPSEMKDFVDGIHKCQDVLALRAVRRAYPDGWPNHASVTPQTRTSKPGTTPMPGPF